MISISNGRTSVPQIIINGTYIPGGFTGLRELNTSGQLDNMLNQTMVRPHPLLASSKLLKKPVMIDIEVLDF